MTKKNPDLAPEERAERIIGRHLSRLSKRNDWAEDDTAVGGQAAHVVRLLQEAGILVEAREIGGASFIAAERRRQISEKGYTLEHDEGHANELVAAAISYADGPTSPDHVPASWPWEMRYWKPSDDEVRNLVRAGALIAAAIDSIRVETKACTCVNDCPEGRDENDCSHCQGLDINDAAFEAKRNPGWWDMTVEIAGHHRLDPQTSNDRCTCGHKSELGKLFSGHIARRLIEQGWRRP